MTESTSNRLTEQPRRVVVIGAVTPAMVATWVLGLWLAWHGPDSHYGWFTYGWLQAKLAVVIVLSAVHGLFARWVKAFAADRNQHSQK